MEDHPIVRSADIINLHWVAGFIDYATFFKRLSGKRIFWTVHDMNPFLGGFHYDLEYKRTNESDLLFEEKIQDLKLKLYGDKLIHVVYLLN